jgi:propanediol dehydratase small subunit
MAHSTWTVYKKKQSSQEMKDISLQNVIELRVRSEDLKSKIETLKTDTGIEEEIRSKFNVTKDNENMVVVVDDEKNVASTTAPKANLWQKIINFLWK